MTEENPETVEPEPRTHNGIVDPDSDQIAKWAQDQKDGEGSAETFNFLTGEAGVPIDEVTTKKNSNSPLNEKFYDDCLGDFKAESKKASGCYDGLESALNNSNAPGLSDGGSGDETTWGSEKDYEVEYSGTIDVDPGDAFPTSTLYGPKPEGYEGDWVEGAEFVRTEFLSVVEANTNFSGTYSGPLPSSEQLTSTTQTGGDFKIKLKQTTFNNDGSVNNVAEFDASFPYVNARFTIGTDGSPTFLGGESAQSGYTSGISGWNSCLKERKQATSISWQKASFAVVGSGCGASIAKSFTTETKAISDWGSFSACGQPFDETQVAGDVSASERVDLDSYNAARATIQSYMQAEADKFAAQTDTTDLTVAAFECLNSMITNITGGETPNYGVDINHPEHPSKKPWFDNMVKAYGMLGYSFPPQANETQNLNGTVIKKLLNQMLNTDSGVKGPVPQVSPAPDVTDDML